MKISSLKSVLDVNKDVIQAPRESLNFFLRNFSSLLVVECDLKNTNTWTFSLRE